MQMNNTTTQFNTTKEEVNTMHTEVNSTKENLTPLTESSPIKSKKQRGASLLDFIFWMGLAAIVIAGIAAMASSGKGKLKINNTLTEVSEIRAAVDAWAGAGADTAGVSLSEICTEGYGYSNAAWCDVNQYGGTYTVTANSSHSSYVDIAISNIEQDNVLALANQLAPVSTERCKKADSECTSVVVADTTITVTM
ncbi:hypothetical protein O4N70_23665 [Vibrio parahaemolyticus]|uniref:hypothetical protein n=1 Tax=Vibrio parahaemolyticus TaxID=670 RepID=UPI00215264E1|nr:hypothetical protein [Vibrio parahaemolyticus]MCX4136375.1 hypothetical protein [Vibrio parahaemolyticus]MCZ6386856.1 hypothetical protein [Vibrio parahaemolyticus]MCZ6417549.1 hypothetical protein [Vibrio parahaemolyticus]MCZ6422517.1 hypothetical protein [Vibrio parahaemolyticus]MDF4861193.1 hypothetical protein [Vibrio parahaemolyticus]